MESKKQKSDIGDLLTVGLFLFQERSIKTVIGYELMAVWGLACYCEMPGIERRLQHIAYMYYSLSLLD